MKGDGERVNFVVGDEGDSAAEDNGDMVVVGDLERRDSSTSQSSDTVQDFLTPVTGRTMDGVMGIIERRRRLR